MEGVAAVEEPTERQMVESLEAQGFAQLSSIVMQQQSALALTARGRQLVLTEERHRHRLDHEAILQLRQIGLQFMEAMTRTAHITYDERRNFAVLRLAEEQQRGHVEECSLDVSAEEDSRRVLYQHEGLERRAMLLDWLHIQKVDVTVSIVLEEAAARGHVIEPMCAREFAVTCACQEEAAERTKCGDDCLRMLAALVVGATAALRKFREMLATAVALIEAEESSCREVICSNASSEGASHFAEAVHAEHVTRLVAMLADEMSDRKCLEKALRVNKSLAALAEQEHEARFALEGRETIIRSAATSDIFDKVYYWTESYRLVAAEARARGGIVRFSERLSWVDVCATALKTLEHHKVTLERDEMMSYFLAGVALHNLANTAEPVARRNIASEEIFERDEQLQRDPIWVMLRSVELVQIEHECREDFVEEWEAESNELETWLLQHLIRLTSIAIGGGSGGGSGSLKAAGNSYSFSTGSNNNFAPSVGFTADSDRLFFKHLLEQEELPRERLHRIESEAFIDVVSRFLEEAEVLHRRELVRAYEADSVTIKWRHKSKHKVLTRTGSLYSSEFRKRIDIEDLQGRQRIALLEMFASWKLFAVVRPRHYILQKALEAKRVLQISVQVERLLMVENHFGAVLEEAERTTFQRMWEKERMLRMVSSGSAGRRAVSLQERNEYIVTLAEPYDRFLLQRRLLSQWVAVIESWQRTHNILELEQTTRLCNFEAPFARKWIVLNEEHVMRTQLWSSHEGLSRRELELESLSAFTQISTVAEHSALLAEQLYLRRCTIDMEQQESLRLEEQLRRRALSLSELVTFQREFSHLSRRVTIHLEESVERQELGHVFHFIIQEPQRRQKVLEEERDAFLDLLHGEMVNQSTAFSAFFQQERHARRRLVCHEADDWETIRLSQRSRRSSMRRVVPLPFKPNQPHTAEATPSGAHSDIDATLLPSASLIEVPQRVVVIVEVPPTTSDCTTDSIVAMAQHDDTSRHVPVLAERVEDAEILTRLQVLRHEDHAFRLLRQNMEQQSDIRKDAISSSSVTGWRSLNSAPHQTPHRVPSKPPHTPLQIPNSRPHTAAALQVQHVTRKDNEGTTLSLLHTPKRPQEEATLERSSHRCSDDGSKRYARPSPGRNLNLSSMVPW